MIDSVQANPWCQNVLFAVCALNELFFIALYLLSFSSPRLSPSLIQPAGELSSAQPGSPAASTWSWVVPGTAAAMEMARYVITTRHETGIVSGLIQASTFTGRTRWIAPYRGH